MKTLFKKPTKSLVLILASLFLIIANYVVSYRTAANYSQSFKLDDEYEYIDIAWLMTKGYRLYRDVQSNHQPLTYLSSEAVIRLIKPDNLFMLLKQHRMFVYAWSLVWSIFLTVRFGLPAVIPLIIFEQLKYFTLGNEFLAESFAAYPLLYLFLTYIDRARKKRPKWEDFLLGMSGATSVWFLVPLAIPVFILFLLRYLPKIGKELWWYISGAMTVAVFIFSQVPFIDYWRETIYFNGKYGVPMLSKFKTPLDVLRLWFLPQLNLLGRPDLLSIVFSLIGIAWIIGFIVLIIRRQYQQLGRWLMVWFLWGLTNVRVNQAHVYYFDAFHLTPWFLVGLAGAAFFLTALYAQLPHKAKYFIPIAITGSLLWLGTRPDLPIRHQPDPFTEDYIQNTPQVQSAQIINALKNPADRLMVIPAESSMHWLTQLLPATRQITYYEWQYQHPILQQQFLMTLDQNPPRFIQYVNDKASFDPIVEQLLAHQYTQLFNQPATYIRTDTLPEITQAQWNAYRSLPADFSGLNRNIHPL